MALNIATGEMTDAPDGLRPLDATGLPGVAPPTPVQPGQLSGPTYPGLDTTAMQAAQMAAGEADARDAMAAAMTAEQDRRAHYAADILPVGTAYGDTMNLPPVPDNALPPAGSDAYPFPGTEPTAAAAGMSGPYIEGAAS